MKPVLTLISYSRGKLSEQTGFGTSHVVFTCNKYLTQFEARATRTGTPYGVGVGTLLCSVANVAEGAEIGFDIGTEDITGGDGAYRISLYGKGLAGKFAFLAVDFGKMDFGSPAEWSD